MTLIDEWLEHQDRLMSEVVWLPLDPALRQEAKYNPEAMKDWILSLKGTKYSFVKEFFAAVDHAEMAWPAPFSHDTVPVALRYLSNYWYTELKDEFLYGLRLRYHALLDQNEIDKTKLRDPLTIEEFIADA